MNRLRIGLFVLSILTMYLLVPAVYNSFAQSVVDTSDAKNSSVVSSDEFSWSKFFQSIAGPAVITITGLLGALWGKMIRMDERIFNLDKSIAAIGADIKFVQAEVATHDKGHLTEKDIHALNIQINDLRRSNESLRDSILKRRRGDPQEEP